jgi:putative selenium metabolism protein SsnA
MPGGICAHTHFHAAFARGLTLSQPAPKDFAETVRRLWQPFQRALLEEDIRYAALMSLSDAIRHGTTTLFDHHASPNAVDGSLDVIAEVIDSSGLRGVLCYAVTDHDGPEVADAAIRENVRFAKRLSAVPHPRLAATFGLNASLSLSGATLQACRASLPEGTGFHLHVAEDESDQYDSLEKTNMRVVDRLQNHGILGPRTIAAHCIHVDALEAMVLKESGTWVAHQPRSNMNNAVGTAPVESLLRAGIKVCLGNDGLSNAMWDEWKAAYLVHKEANRDPRRMSADQVAFMAAANNAALASAYFPAAHLGSIVRGAFADLILVDYHPPTPLTVENLALHIIFGFQSSMVTATIVAGKVLMKDRKLTTLDEAEIAARAQDLAPRLWRRFEENAAQ